MSSYLEILAFISGFAGHLTIGISLEPWQIQAYPCDEITLDFIAACIYIHPRTKLI